LWTENVASTFANFTAKGKEKERKPSTGKRKAEEQGGLKTNKHHKTDGTVRATSRCKAKTPGEQTACESENTREQQAVCE
jgi:hypothetical protein